MEEVDYAENAVASWRGLRGDIDLTRYSVALRIMRLAAMLQASLDAELADAGFTVMGDYDVVSLLRRAERPLLPSDIAELLRTTRAGVTGRLIRLEAAGFVRRERSSHDLRNVLVSLTPRGRRATDRAFDRVVACEDEILSVLSPGELGELARLLRRVGARHDALLPDP